MAEQEHSERGRLKREGMKAGSIMCSQDSLMVQAVGLPVGLQLIPFLLEKVETIGYSTRIVIAPSKCFEILSLAAPRETISNENLNTELSGCSGENSGQHH